MQTKTNTLTFKHTFLYVIVTVVILITGCRGKDGPMGPQGDDGLMGPQGNDGPMGNANVHSVQYQVNTGAWSGNANGYKTVLSVPEITSGIVDSGSVLVYVLKNVDDPYNEYFYMLPNTSIDSTSVTYMDFDVFIGEIDLTYDKTDNGVNDTQAPSADMYFKVVIIEGMPLDALKERVNISDYKAVSKYFGLSNKPNAEIILK